MSEKRSNIALEWVSREIEETLSQAFDALESFIQNSDDITKLRFCLTYIHQVAGSLKMIELHGAALLAEEIEKVLVAIQQETIAAEKISSSADEISQTIKILVTYINKVNDSGEDNPKELLPALNSIQKLLPQNGQPTVFSEADIFNPNISHARQSEHQQPEIETDEFNELIRKLRQGFQKGLVGVVRAENLPDNYQLLKKVSAALYKASKNTSAEPLWQIAYALIEQMCILSEPAELEAKKALSLVDKQIKHLEQYGSAALSHIPDASVLKTLLYSVATAQSNTPLIEELKQTYNLHDALTQENASAKKSGQVGSSSRDLINASREKLEEVKELFVECVASQWDKEIVAPVPQLLASVNESLEAASFTLLQPYVDAAKNFIETEIIGTDKSPDWQVIESYADVISSLDFYLECAHAEGEKKLKAILQGANESLEKLGYQLATESEVVLNNVDEESISVDIVDEDEVDEEILEIFIEEAEEVTVNINDFLPQLVDNAENHEALTELRRAYHTLKGSGRMVKAFAIGDFAWSIERMLNRILDGESSVTPNCLLILQEATSYIPTILTAFEKKIAVDKETVDAIIAKADAEWAGQPGEENASVAIEEVEIEAPAEIEPVSMVDVDPLGLNTPEEAIIPQEITAPDDDEIDDEILEIFIEEAAEVLESIHISLPQLKQNNADQNALADLRRSFHTLKGSGRMVKAFTMGDFAWSIERMLNKVMDENASLTASCFSVLDDAVAYIPTMMDMFEGKLAMDRPKVDEIIAKADIEREGLVKGDDKPAPETVIENVIVSAPVEAIAPEILDEDVEEADVIDEDILEIFTEEAAEVLENIMTYLPQLHQDQEDSNALAELRRSYHTLKGSGRMVQAFVVGDFAWAVERMLNKVVDGSAKVTGNCLSVLDEATAYIPVLLAAFEAKLPINQTEVDAIITKADAEWEGRAEPENIEVEEKPKAIEVEETSWDSSDELMAIFSGEAQSHLQVFLDYLDNIEPGFEDVEVSDELQRCFHTLKGSAYMAGVTVLAELVTPLETLVKNLNNYHIKADAEILAVFVQASLLIQKQLKALDAGDLKHTDESLQFIEDVNTLYAKRIELSGQDEDASFGLVDNYSVLLTEALECMTLSTELLLQWRMDNISAEDKQSLPSLVRRLSDTASTAHYPEVAALSVALANYLQNAISLNTKTEESFFVLVDKANDELDDMFDMLAAQQTVESASEIISELESASESLLSTTEESIDEETPIVESSSIEGESSGIDTALYQQQLQQADEETLEIFLEEACEIMDSLDEHIHGWLDAHDDVSNLPEIKRSLHTLKGGARLSELPVMGDLTHEYESLIEHAELTTAYNSEFFVQIESYQQQLQLLVDFASQGDESILQSLQLTQTVVDNIEVESTKAQETKDATAAVSHDVDLSQLTKECEKADEDTLEIFIEEAEELATALENSTSAWLADHEKIDEAAELKRILHTLKGGARMTELSSMGDLTHEFETMIEAAEVGRDFNAHFFTQLQAYQESVQKMIDCVLHLESSDANIDEPATGFSSAPLSVEPLITQEVVDDKPAVIIPTAELVPEDSGFSEDEETDEILTLFLEESKEQSEGIEECIAQLLKDRNDRAPLEEIKRLLHTVKGGARMAGQMAAGDLSHDFETFIINAERDDTLLADNFIDELQSFQEKQSQLLDGLQNSLQPQQIEEEHKNVVPIRADVDVDQTAQKVTQAAVDATKSFIENFNQQQQQKRSAQEPVKVAPDLLDGLINLAGESSIGRSRIEEQVNDLAFSVDEMDVTVDRLHGQLRRLEIETEAQIVFRQEQFETEGIENFDPLEMDRYSQMQQLSKSLIESASDLDDISGSFTNKMRDMETLLVQQGRINSELQEGLMRCQMVPFSRMVPRLRRIIRQISSELGKKVEFSVENAEGELDRTILERMIAPLEHMLRNAVDHGIEMPGVRKKAGKDEKGKVTLVISREGGEVVLTLKDNGAGVNIDAVKSKAIERGLINANADISDHEVCQFILHAGFSTAAKVTQISGRGVGMDVVSSEIKQMGGTLEIYSQPGQGSEFIVRLPFTVSVNRALMVTVGNDTYALPLNTIEGIVRVSPYELEAYYQPDAPMFEYAGQSYNLRYMGSLLHRGQQAKLEGLSMPLPVILIRSTEYTVAVQVDKLLGSQEVVVKTLGPQFSMVDGLSGATVLGDGSVVIILDTLALIRADAARIIDADNPLAHDGDDAEQEATMVMVVDDSVTVRKVTSRLLERYDIDVVLAKDGLDAITQLAEMERLPDVMLLDIEMPRMDGFEVVSRVRHNERLEHIPICMITSRTGDKHRERALSLGASEYLGKPFQERELLQTISRLTGVEVIPS